MPKSINLLSSHPLWYSNKLWLWTVWHLKETNLSTPILNNNQQKSLILFQQINNVHLDDVQSLFIFNKNLVGFRLKIETLLKN